MKIAFFDASGAPCRLFRGQPADAEAVKRDPLFAAHAVRVLDGTTCAAVMQFSDLPNLADFDAANPSS